MTDGERDPAESDDWPLGEMIRQAIAGRSENSIADLAKNMGPDYVFSRPTLRNYMFGFRESGGLLRVTEDTVRRIAAVLRLDPHEALIAAGLHEEAEREAPPRIKVGAPLDTTEVLAKKLAELPYEDRAAFQRILDSLVAARDGVPERTAIVSTPGGEAWQGPRSAGGRGGGVPAEESRETRP